VPGISILVASRCPPAGSSFGSAHLGLECQFEFFDAFCGQLTLEFAHFAYKNGMCPGGIFVAMSAFGDTIITSLVVVGMIWIAVLSASFREALGIFAGLGVATVILSVIALSPLSVKLFTVPAASHSEQSIQPQPGAPGASVLRERALPGTAPNLEGGTPIDVEADVSAIWAVQQFDAELRRQCEPCREAAGPPITVLKYDASTEFLHAIADGVSLSIHAVGRFGRKFTVYWFSELDPGGDSWSAHCGLPALERGLRVTGFKTQADAEAWLMKASARMRELGVKVDG
jgi:hypothetical protein